jgi:hypothetical protein
VSCATQHNLPNGHEEEKIVLERAHAFLDVILIGPNAPSLPQLSTLTDKKENQIFLKYKEIQSGAVAKPYMRKGFLIYEEMRKYFPIYEEAVSYILLATPPF